MTADRGILPVKTSPYSIVKPYVAASRIPFGSAVVYSAAGTVATALTADTDGVVGIAVDDEREHTYGGFYEAYETVPVIVAGTARVLVGNLATGSNSLIAGDFVEVGAHSSSPTGVYGVLAEAGSAAGEARTTHVVAKMLENVTLGSLANKKSFTVAVGDTTATFHTTGDLAVMGLAVGDYVLLADIDAEVQVNQVTSISSDTFGLAVPSTVSLTDNTDYIFKLVQADALLTL